MNMKLSFVEGSILELLSHEVLVNMRVFVVQQELLEGLSGFQQKLDVPPFFI